MSGFLTSLLLGFPRLDVRGAAPETWAKAPVALPAGWKVIDVDRVFDDGKPMKRMARQEELATLTPIGD